MPNTYTIGEVAAKMNIPTSTLRYYDNEGLLPFVHRSAGGMRVFRKEDLAWLRLIKCLKATNMPIKDIKAFIDWYMEGDSTLQKRRDMFYERRQAVEDQIKVLQETLDVINYKCWFYDTAVEAGTTAVPKAMRLQDMPEEIRGSKERTDL